ncbi:tryptophan synthase subunit alpha [Candidatus Xiphinematobacter sp. Idaho Grape]|uniref:tryptophan synthase subunit alpha n=1 Tax=Candidatus Xiphinematobacter sp. Idaho Grape TaxID=1704307 RepID=UPI000784BA79|nr:tryptophan synthase subunit alpha [Candidatus Xiphinematobacter sp. Idaho Grape]
MSKQSRMDVVFARLRSQKKRGLIAYITGGDPSLKGTLEIIHVLEELGVDMLELGIPFSDPLADGPTIQAAIQRALRAGSSVEKILELISHLRESSSLPVILFTYLNPIYFYGIKRFLEDAISAGVDGLLVLDLPPDEVSCNEDLAIGNHQLQIIQLVSPTTPQERIPCLVNAARGFVYCVSREGVTGERPELATTLRTQLQSIRQYTSLPIAVGFGISTPDQVRVVAGYADAVVIGSAIVRRIAEYASSPRWLLQIKEFVEPLVETLRTA